MKALSLFATLAVLSACAPSEQAAEPEATDVATEAVPAVDGGPAHGLYRVTLPDGSIMMDDVREDGTYTSTMADGSTESGTWVQKPNVYCATADTEGAEEICYPEKIDENGVWTAETPEGQFSVIERITETE